MKKILVIITLIFINISFLEASYTDTDPCFFRLTAKNARKIYVLGSAHALKIEETLPSQAFKEFKRIVTEENPILFTEHKLSNKDALNIMSCVKEKSEKYWAESVITKEHYSMMDDQILIEPTIFSELKIKNLLGIDPWLAAPILSTHVNSIFYPNFSGTEYELETNELWTKYWSGINYLEDFSHYKLLEESALQDKDHNIQWIKNSLYKLSLMKPLLDKSIKEDEIERKVLELEQENAKKSINVLLEETKENYLNTGWQVVLKTSKNIPQSAILRNKLWASTIIEKLSKIDEDKKSILIIVGNGHLVGVNENLSFLSFLIDSLLSTTTERFINKSGIWKNVHE